MRQRQRALLQHGQIFSKLFQQCVVEILFPCQGAFARAQHLVLECLELGRDVAFNGLQGLPSDVVVRYSVTLRFADFDVKSMDAVISDLEGVDSRLLLLLRLEVEQELIGIGAECP